MCVWLERWKSKKVENSLFGWKEKWEDRVVEVKCVRCSVKSYPFRIQGQKWQCIQMDRQINRQDRHCALRQISYRQRPTDETLLHPLQTTGLMWQKQTKRRQETDRYKKKTRDQKINPERYFSRILFVRRFSQTEKILFTSMRTQTDTDR